MGHRFIDRRVSRAGSLSRASLAIPHAARWLLFSMGCLAPTACSDSIASPTPTRPSSFFGRLRKGQTEHQVKLLIGDRPRLGSREGKAEIVLSKENTLAAVYFAAGDQREGCKRAFEGAMAALSADFGRSYKPVPQSSAGVASAGTSRTCNTWVTNAFALTLSCRETPLPTTQGKRSLLPANYERRDVEPAEPRGRTQELIP